MDNDVVMSDMEGKALMSYENSNALKSIKKIASELEILLE